MSISSLRAGAGAFLAWLMELHSVAFGKWQRYPLGFVCGFNCIMIMTSAARFCWTFGFLTDMSCNVSIWRKHFAAVFLPIHHRPCKCLSIVSPQNNINYLL